jgi:hypothetical protein
VPGEAGDEKGKDVSYDELKGALDKFFGDTSRSRAETRDGLESLLEQIKLMLEALDDDAFRFTLAGRTRRGKT